MKVRMARCVAWITATAANALRIAPDQSTPGSGDKVQGFDSILIVASDMLIWVSMG